MMLYRNTKVKVRSPDWDTDFFDIVAVVLQEDASVLFVYNALNIDSSDKTKLF